MQHYDYLIIGAGSAGCVLANRLSAQSNNSVAVFESGPDSNSWKVDMPSALLHTMHDPNMNWKYYSEPEPHLNNRKIFCPRGKMIGGCSSHNGMVFVRGHAQDFNRWSKNGLPKWSYRHVLPYFKKLETSLEGESQYRGKNGPLLVSKSKVNEKFPLFQAALNAAVEAGYPISEDFNGYMQDGFGTYDLTIKDGIRIGAAKAYLQDTKQRKNVEIFIKTNVQKILFENLKAIGIQIMKKGKLENIYANKEVIVASGSINSPKLLQLSGIGDEHELRQLGIEVTHHLPGVGKNLQDHLEIYVQHESKTSDTLYSLFNNPFLKVFSGIQWFLSKKGLLAHSHLELGGFVKSDARFDHPNIQLHFFPALVINHGLTNPDRHAFQFHASPNRPTSRGWVKLRSSNPEEDPAIQFNYLETEEDRLQMRDCVKIARNIFSQKSFQHYAGKELRPGKNVQDNDVLDEIIRNTSDTAYHPSCTNKMGDDKFSVVDDETKVRGISNLRVIDSSIMPDIVSGNINAATLMIAEKASDIILGREEEPIDVDIFAAA